MVQFRARGLGHGAGQRTILLGRRLLRGAPILLLKSEAKNSASRASQEATGIVPQMDVLHDVKLGYPSLTGMCELCQNRAYLDIPCIRNDVKLLPLGSRGCFGAGITVQLQKSAMTVN